MTRNRTLINILGVIFVALLIGILDYYRYKSPERFEFGPAALIISIWLIFAVVRVLCKD